MVIHFSVLAVILICALIWEPSIKNNKISCIYNGQSYDYKSQLLPWLIVFGYITFLAAMRSNVNDTSAYINSFNRIPGTWEGIKDILNDVGKDKAFDITANLFKMYISSDYHMWFAFFAIIESSVFIYVLRRESVSFLDSCFLFFATTLYYNYFSMMRQWFAVALVFFGSKFLKEKRIVPYIIVCVIAAQYHNSAYLLIPLYFVVSGKAWSWKQNGIWAISVVCLLFLNPILSTLQFTTEGTTYDYAISAMVGSTGSSGLRAVIAVVPILIAFVCRNYIDEDNEMINICINMSMINFLLNVLATFTSGLYVIRLATYMSVYSLILYPYLLNIAISDRSRKIVKTGFYIIYFIFYCYQMVHQGSFGYSSDILGSF